MCSVLALVTRDVWLNIFGNGTKTDPGVFTAAWKVHERFSCGDLVQFDRNNAFINLLFSYNSTDTQ